MKDLGKIVDELGEIKEIIKNAKKREEALLKKLESVEIGTVIEGDTYRLMVSEVIQTELNPSKVRDYLKDDAKFMAMVSITKKAAGSFLLAPEIERLSEISGYTKRYAVHKK